MPLGGYRGADLYLFIYLVFIMVVVRGFLFSLKQNCNVAYFVIIDVINCNIASLWSFYDSVVSFALMKLLN